MKIALHLTDRLKYSWPPDYCREFAYKAAKAGHEVHMVATEPNIVVEVKKDGLVDRTKEDAEVALRDCDVFVGPPLHLSEIAGRLGLKVVTLQGASLKGEGVRSTTFCVGCDSEGKLPPRLDCLWEDEICMLEILPNDVMEAICGSRDTLKTGEPAHN